MLWHRTSKTIIEHWEADAAYGLEAGKKPVFSLGSSNISMDGLLALRALQKMFEKRDTIVRPLIAMGGHSTLWLFALLQTTRLQTTRHQTTRHQTTRNHSQTQASPTYGSQSYSHTRSPNILFTGVDPATQIAALATQTSTETARDVTAISPKERWTGLNAAMRHQFAPTSEPSAISQAASLPFTTEPIRDQHALNRYTNVKSIAHQSTNTQSTTSNLVDEETRWTARAMIGLALLMLLTALFL